MYCSTCGKPVTSGLSYCNHCGARLNEAKGSGIKQAELFTDSLVWAIVSVFIVGFGCTIGLMAVMKDGGNFSPGMILTVTLLSFAVMLAVEAILIWLLLSRRRNEMAGVKTEGIIQAEGTAYRELDGARAKALPEPLSSVTEHTTRTLEPVPRERKAN